MAAAEFNASIRLTVSPKPPAGPRFPGRAQTSLDLNTSPIGRLPSCATSSVFCRTGRKTGTSELAAEIGDITVPAPLTTATEE